MSPLNRELRKVVVISNEDKINWDNGGKESFLKTVRFVYEFSNTPEEIVRIGLDNVADSLQDSQKNVDRLFLDHLPTLVALLEDAKCFNLRTFTKAAKLFADVYESNSSQFDSSPEKAINFFEALLATIILTDHHYLSEDNRRRLLNPSVANYTEFELTIGDDKDPSEEQNLIHNLLIHAIYSAKGYPRFGIISLVKNGFYIKDDFSNAFADWQPTTSLERYFNTIEFLALPDEEANKIFTEAHDAIFDRQTTDPNLLAKFILRAIEDVMRGILDHEVDNLKDRFRQLVHELYDSCRMDRVRLDLFFIQRPGFYAQEALNEAQDILNKMEVQNEEYWQSPEKTNLLSDMWGQFAQCDDSDSLHELLDRYKQFPMFSSWDSTEQVIRALEGYDNETLLTLTRSLGSRVKDTECADALRREKEKSGKLADAINQKYGNQYGIRAGHFKQLYRLLKY